MAKDRRRFDEKTILKTPDPVFSSSMKTNKKYRKNYDLDDIPQRDNSLGILSFKSDDLDLSKHLQNERELARLSLGKAKSIPMHLLQKKQEISTEISTDHYINTESTISESDLFPGNSSTPRASLLNAMEFRARDQGQDRSSMGAFFTSLGRKLRDGSFDFEQFGSFHSGDSALAKIEAGERSWQSERDIPVEKAEFSFEEVGPPKLSMGVFFKQKSDDLSNLMTESPKPFQAPVPLIDASTVSEARDEQSLNVSDIQKLLSDTKQTPGRALDYFLNYDKKNNLASTDCSYQESRKENIDTMNLSVASIQSGKLSPTSNSSMTSIQSRKLSPNRSSGSTSPSNLSVESGDLSPNNNDQKSILSSRTSSALSSLPQGKLPIETTKNELIWGCIRLGKTLSNEFIIRNRTSSRLGVKCTLSNPSFRFNEGTEFTNTMKIILHPFESRKLSVVFAPTTIGAAADNLVFSPLDPNYKHTVKQFIKLFGYGGFANVVITDVIKDTTGRFLLSLGSTTQGNMVTKCFTIRNNGTLPGFASIRLNWNGLSSQSMVSVAPQFLVLLPEEEGKVTVTYNPQKTDFSYMKNKLTSILELAKVEVTCGVEADRGRLRKICEKAKEKGSQVGGAIAKLVQKFPGELMPADLKLLRESSGSMDEVLRLFNMKEIVVCIEQDTDVTMVPQLQDESAMFHSLCENSNADKFEYTVQNDTCQVEPNRIILTSDKLSDMIFLNNFSDKQLYFEVRSSPEGLVLKPKDGTVGPGATCTIRVNCVRVCRELTVFRCRILVDNDCFDVDIKVLPNFKNGN